MNKTSGPKWPFILGPIISAAGIVMGYTIPVGSHCGGAFNAYSAEAAGYDIAQAMRGVQSRASEACIAAAPAQMGIYWGIICFGVAIVILGVVLRSIVHRRPVVAPAGPTVSSADELARLANLRDRGILTDEEFETQKRRILLS